MRAFEMTLKISLFHLDAVVVVQLNGQILIFLEGRMIALLNMRVVVLMTPQSARTGVHVAMLPIVTNDIVGIALYGRLDKIIAHQVLDDRIVLIALGVRIASVEKIAPSY